VRPAAARRVSSREERRAGRCRWGEWGWGTETQQL